MTFLKPAIVLASRHIGSDKLYRCHVGITRVVSAQLNAVS